MTPTSVLGGSNPTLTRTCLQTLRRPGQADGAWVDPSVVGGMVPLCQAYGRAASVLRPIRSCLAKKVTFEWQAIHSSQSRQGALPRLCGGDSEVSGALGDFLLTAPLKASSLHFLLLPAGSQADLGA